MKKLTLLIACACWAFMAGAQHLNIENQYALPLNEVFGIMEQRYNVKITCPEEFYAGRNVSFALYRFEPDFLTTFSAILASQSLSYVVGSKNTYVVKRFEYPRIAPEAGLARLTAASEKYTDLAAWTARREALRQGVYDSLQIDPMRRALLLNFKASAPRKMNGYTVANFSLETLPGLYVNGSIYRPAKYKGKIPLILNPNGHFKAGRYDEAMQYRCAMFARMGAIAINWDLFAYGESLLAFRQEDHKTSMAQRMQVLNILALVEHFSGLAEVDPDRIAMTGASGGGSQTVIGTLLDDRIKVAAPVVMVSSYFIGGCPCESGMPIHLAGGGTTNTELAACAAPRPMLLVSDGADWTSHCPQYDFPYLKKIYGFYGAAGEVYNVHLPDEKHDYGFSKRAAVYEFMARELRLDVSAGRDSAWKWDESTVTIEPEEAMRSFGPKGENAPANLVKGFANLQKLVDSYR